MPDMTRYVSLGRRVSFPSVSLVWAILAGVAVAGCDASTDGTAIIRSDSAGVEIVETHRAEWDTGNGWTVSSEPSMQIGEVSGDAPYLFSDVRGAVRLEDGGIIVGDGQSREVRYFGPDGVFVWAVGGPGDGPSEFPQSLVRLERCGRDRLYAVDQYARRVIAFSTTGEFLRVVPFSEPGSERIPYAYECTEDGGFIAIGWGDIQIRPELPPGQEAMMYSQYASAWVLDSLNAVSVELGEFLSSERLFIQQGSSYGSGSHPFGRATKFASRQDRIYLGTGEGLALRLYQDGRLTRIQRALTESLALDDDIIQAYYDAAVSGLAARDRGILELADAFPPEIPGFTELLTSPEGNVWAERFALQGGGPSRWGVFSPGGVFLGHVMMPAGFSLMEVGEDYLLGVVKDELDVERVTVFALKKS